MGLPSRIYGVKWEPVAAMIALLFVGYWLVTQPGVATHKDGYVLDVLVANERGIIEVYTPEGDAAPIFRLALRNGHEREMSADEVQRFLGDEVLTTLTNRPNNVLFRLLNITSWVSLVWVAIGYGGQVLFAGRTLVQWFVSEQERRSVVPPVFWWMSLVGGLALFAYFTWRRDMVGVLGQCSGVVIYARNIRLIYKHKRRSEEAALAPAPSP